MTVDRSEPLWVVSAYFNPTRSANRLANYRTFRRHLRAPLLTVELAAPDMHELAPDDAETLISLTGEPYLWQKERLINLAIARLPPHVRFVAWVDCDVIFERPDWPQLAATKSATVLPSMPLRTDAASVAPVRIRAEKLSCWLT